MLWNIFLYLFIFIDIIYRGEPDREIGPLNAIFFRNEQTQKAIGQKVTK